MSDTSANIVTPVTVVANNGTVKKRAIITKRPVNSMTTSHGKPTQAVQRKCGKCAARKMTSANQ